MSQLFTQARENRQQKFEAAWELLADDKISLEKFEKIRKLLTGVNPQLDKTLTAVGQTLKKLKQVFEGDIITLSAAALPAKTAKEKKRKKALLAFLSTWKSLKSEVKRVQKLVDEQIQSGSANGASKSQLGAKILRGTKGPFGLITAAAVVVAAGLGYLQTKSATVNITNQGCDSLVINQSLPLSLPGLKIPQGEIPAGTTVQAVLPPLTVKVNSLPSGLVTLTAFNFKINFELEPQMALTFNGQSLLDQASTIKLGEQATHSLIIACR